MMTALKKHQAIAEKAEKEKKAAREKEEKIKKQKLEKKKKVSGDFYCNSYLIYLI